MWFRGTSCGKWPKATSILLKLKKQKKGNKMKNEIGIVLENSASCLTQGRLSGDVTEGGLPQWYRGF